MQLFNLEDDIGVVTGALGKLGPIWVETLLAAGARVLALDRPEVAGIVIESVAAPNADRAIRFQTSAGIPIVFDAVGVLPYAPQFRRRQRIAAEVEEAPPRRRARG